jgi:hypothetical protein
VNLIDQFKAWRKRRYWAQQHMDFVKRMVREDWRWLGTDHIANEMATRYLYATEDDWYSIAHEPIDKFRTRLGLDPHRGAGTKPEAIRLAERLDKGGYFTHIEMNQCGNELRRQHRQLDGYRRMVDRFHHVMKNHGLHPGRTDDDLIDILDAALKKAKP